MLDGRLNAFHSIQHDYYSGRNIRASKMALHTWILKTKKRNEWKKSGLAFIKASGKQYSFPLFIIDGIARWLWLPFWSKTHRHFLWLELPMLGIVRLAYSPYGTISLKSLFCLEFISAFRSRRQKGGDCKSKNGSLSDSGSDINRTKKKEWKLEKEWAESKKRRKRNHAIWIKYKIPGSKIKAAWMAGSKKKKKNKCIHNNNDCNTEAQCNWIVNECRALYGDGYFKTSCLFLVLLVKMRITEYQRHRHNNNAYNTE